MNIIIDSNVFFSALIKNSLTRKMILLYTGKFLFPSFIFDEMEKHKGELEEKSGMGTKQFELLLTIPPSKGTNRATFTDGVSTRSIDPILRSL